MKICDLNQVLRVVIPELKKNINDPYAQELLGKLTLREGDNIDLPLLISTLSEFLDNCPINNPYRRLEIDDTAEWGGFYVTRSFDKVGLRYWVDGNSKVRKFNILKFFGSRQFPLYLEKILPIVNERLSVTKRPDYSQLGKILLDLNKYTAEINRGLERIKYSNDNGSGPRRLLEFLGSSDSRINYSFCGSEEVYIALKDKLTFPSLNILKEYLSVKFAPSSLVWSCPEAYCSYYGYRVSPEQDDALIYLTVRHEDDEWRTCRHLLDTLAMIDI